VRRTDAPGNLRALKALLLRYVGKLMCSHIDPP
jgi:hypothetical protein